ncbi:glycosyl transferase, family 25 [Devosia lucknowensis]|uniref:Glycosyl transferase, family 25 n=1 Tax=Devosia lucknowensis TaxID=1096929 RepID=A0A1Y6EZN3_9HYPH|nr:glycosyltransferase family 25 protein [Devosia lucknowensis]SMQ65703.1 glycosyl transferase, family 25 [Devosia lucknowensis]
MLPIFYINLASRPDRRRFMEDQLQSLGLAGVRIEAATPSDISAEQAALHCDPHKPVYLRPRELACTLSHERVWQALLDAGHDRALVLEDDAELSSALPDFLSEIGAIDADMVRIESAGRPLRVFPAVATLPGEIALHPFRSTPMGSAAYILTRGAARYLLGHPSFRSAQTDLVLYNPFDEPGSGLTRLQAVPALARQLGDEGKQKQTVGRSDIDQKGDRHLFPSERPLQYRLLRLGQGFKAGWRNVSDHISNLSKGLERRYVRFMDEG